MRFWNLSISQRREIAMEIGLINKDDMKTPEPERYRRALLRAGEIGLIDRLAQEIKRREERV